MSLFKKTKAPTPTKQSKIDNPYLNARRVWNDEMGALVAGKRQWQILAIVSLLIAIGALGAYVYSSSQSKYIPYVVKVDELGQTAAVGPVQRASAADPKVIQSYLASFIQNVRVVTPDRELQRKAIFDSYSLIKTDTSAFGKLNDYLNGSPKSSPFKRAETETVSTKIISVLQQSENSWQVNWDESIYDRDGHLLEQPTRWSSILTTYISPPDSSTSDEEMRRNPLGIFISDFSWAKQNFESK